MNPNVVIAALMILPSAYWPGLLQPVTHAVAWQVGTVVLTAVALGYGRWCCRPCLPACWLMLGAVASCAFHWTPGGFPFLILITLTSCLWTLSLLALGTAETLERGIIGLAALNLLYALAQAVGYDPIFQWQVITGLIGKRNDLSVLWLVAVPLVAGWKKLPFILAICWQHHTASVLGLVGLAGYWAWTQQPRNSLAWIVAGLVMLVGVGWAGVYLTHTASMRVVPRLLIWKETLTQALGSPIWGWGLGMRSHMSTVGGVNDPAYSIYLEAFHAGGLVLLAPLLVFLSTIWESSNSPARTALILLAWCGLMQSLWDSPALVMVTGALLAAWERRRTDACFV